MEQKLLQPIRWQVLEYDPRQSNPDWIWGLGLIMVVGIILSLLFGNFLFAIIILLGGVILISYARRQPELIDYEINTEGVRAGHRFYPYTQLDSFWIIGDQPTKKILLESKRSLMPLIDLPLGNTDPLMAYNYLAKYLKPEKHEQSIFSLIADWLNI